ncbi:MAG: response regulator transcription factor [Actinobacteria bacterium]|nr:response regulator transcription factor [Actinomycetota bacterium]MCA1720073.1 response regulator transcription factor [Actinomycetota bacterium]
MRVVIAEDSALLREGLARVLTARGFQVVGQAVDGEDLLRKVAAVPPDVVITDIRMPPSQTDEGLKAAEALAQRHPNVGVLVLSQYLESAIAVRLLERRTAGVGYLLKDRVSDGDAFAEAVLRVGRGGSAVDPAIVAQLTGRARVNDPLAVLTARERDILSAMAEGRSNSAIAETLFVTVKTVESHVANVFSKLGLPPADDTNRRVLAVLAYLRNSEGAPARSSGVDAKGG